MLHSRLFLAAFVLPLAAIALQGGSCKGGGAGTIMSNQSGDDLPKGVWGGDVIVMEVNDKGATIEYECARGTIDQHIVLDKERKFSVTGTHTRERGGPRAGDSHPARYSGHSDGKSLTLTVRLSDTNETVGTFTLERGKRPNPAKCL